MEVGLLMPPTHGHYFHISVISLNVILKLLSLWFEVRHQFPAGFLQFQFV